MSQVTSNNEKQQAKTNPSLDDETLLKIAKKKLPLKFLSQTASKPLDESLSNVASKCKMILLDGADEDVPKQAFAVSVENGITITIWELELHGAGDSASLVKSVKCYAMKRHNKWVIRKLLFGDFLVEALKSPKFVQHLLGLLLSSQGKKNIQILSVFYTHVIGFASTTIDDIKATLDKEEAKAPGCVTEIVTRLKAKLEPIHDSYEQLRKLLHTPLDIGSQEPTLAISDAIKKLLHAIGSHEQSRKIANSAINELLLATAESKKAEAESKQAECTSLKQLLETMAEEDSRFAHSGAAARETETGKQERGSHAGNPMLLTNAPADKDSARSDLVARLGEGPVQGLGSKEMAAAWGIIHNLISVIYRFVSGSDSDSNSGSGSDSDSNSVLVIKNLVESAMQHTEMVDKLERMRKLFPPGSFIMMVRMVLRLEHEQVSEDQEMGLLAMLVEALQEMDNDFMQSTIDSIRSSDIPIVTTLLYLESCRDYVFSTSAANASGADRFLQQQKFIEPLVRLFAIFKELESATYENGDKLVVEVDGRFVAQNEGCPVYEKVSDEVKRDLKKHANKYKSFWKVNAVELKRAIQKLRLPADIRQYTQKDRFKRIYVHYNPRQEDDA